MEKVRMRTTPAAHRAPQRVGATGSAPVAPKQRSEADPELLSFRKLIVTRAHLVLFVAETAAILLRLDKVAGHVPAILCIALLLVYNLATLCLPALSAANLPAPL